MMTMMSLVMMTEQSKQTMMSQHYSHTSPPGCEDHFVILLLEVFFFLWHVIQFSSHSHNCFPLRNEKGYQLRPCSLLPLHHFRFIRLHSFTLPPRSSSSPSFSDPFSSFYSPESVTATAPDVANEFATLNKSTLRIVVPLVVHGMMVSRCLS